MTTYGLLLDGWEQLSTWGWDEQGGYYYAQLTRNESNDDDGPDIWIAPGKHPLVITEVGTLLFAIAQEVKLLHAVDVVRSAMNAGAKFAGEPPPVP